MIIPVPYSPVPITLQTLFCVLSGAFLGKYRGAASQLVYVLLGLAGLPVFSRGASGLGALFGPTGGYLLGFVAGAFVCGLLAEKGLALAGMAAGIIVIYSIGMVQLKYMAGITWSKSFMAGAVPFVPGDIVKVIIGYAVYRKISATDYFRNIKSKDLDK